jgi:putative ABC transport system substrate-binding protein
MWHRTFAAIVASLTLSASQAWGQQEQVHRIGYFGGAPLPETRQAWLQGLREHGYVEGQNLQIEYRYSQGQSEKYPALIAELIASNPEVIVTSQATPR